MHQTMGTLHREPSVHEVLTLRVGTGFCVQRVDKTEFISLLCEVRKKVRNHLAGLSPRTEFPEWLRDISVGPSNVTSGIPGGFCPWNFSSSGL